MPTGMKLSLRPVIAVGGPERPDDGDAINL
jgi:hypothetical protein